MHVGLIRLPLSPPLSGGKIACFGSHFSRYGDFGSGTSIHQKCHLIGQKDKEIKKLSVERKCGKSQYSKRPSFPLSLSLLLLLLQKRPPVFKEHLVFKSFGCLSPVPPLEGWTVPSCFSQVRISDIGSYLHSWLRSPQ